MTEVTLTLDGITQQLRQYTEYIGAKGGEYDKVRATKYDKGLLQHWFAVAVADTANLLDRLVQRPVLVNGGEAHLKLDIKNQRGDEVGDAVANVIVLDMLVRWLMLTAPTLVESYNAIQTAAQGALGALCYYRDMPK